MADSRRFNEIMYKTFTINGIIQSIVPAEETFNYSYWSQQIPPFGPENALMLGHGQGTTAALIKKIWPETKITGADIRNNSENCDIFINKDAREVIADSEKYDYVVVDIFEGGGIPEWVFEEEFVRSLARITNKLLSINILTLQKYDLKKYEELFDLDLVKEIGYNKIYFFKAKDNKESYFLV